MAVIIHNEVTRRVIREGKNHKTFGEKSKSLCLHACGRSHVHRLVRCVCVRACRLTKHRSLNKQLSKKHFKELYPYENIYNLLLHHLATIAATSKQEVKCDRQKKARQAGIVLASPPWLEIQFQVHRRRGKKAQEFFQNCVMLLGPLNDSHSSTSTESNQLLAER